MLVFEIVMRDFTGFFFSESHAVKAFVRGFIAETCIDHAFVMKTSSVSTGNLLSREGVNKCIKNTEFLTLLKKKNSQKQFIY